MTHPQIIEIDPAKKNFLRSATSKKIGVAVLATTAFWGAVSGSLALSKESPSNKPPVAASTMTPQDIRNEVIQATVTEEQAHDAALASAALYNETLKSDHTIENVYVLNGTVEVQGKDGKYLPGYKYPIILGVLDPAGFNSTTFKLETGDWIGVQGSDHMTIVPVAYNSGGNPPERFVPNDPNGVLVLHPSISMTTFTDSVRNETVREPVAFDSQGNQLKAADGSLIDVGSPSY